MKEKGKRRRRRERGRGEGKTRGDQMKEREGDRKRRAEPLEVFLDSKEEESCDDGRHFH